MYNKSMTKKPKNNTQRTTDLIFLAGGEVKTAKGCGITRQHLWRWVNVPEKHETTIRRLAKANIKGINRLFNKYYGEIE